MQSDEKKKRSKKEYSSKELKELGIYLKKDKKE
jgi:hypothetical protein